MIPLDPHLQHHVYGVAVSGSKGVTPLAEFEAEPQKSLKKLLNILLVVAEIFQQKITIAPILLDLHPQLQING